MYVFWFFYTSLPLPFYYVFKFSLYQHLWTGSPGAIRLIHEFPITGSIARQPLLMADQACNCWSFFITNTFNGLIFNMEYDIQLNIRIITVFLIISSAQTCLNCPDRVTGGAKTSTSQGKLRKGHDGIRTYDAYKVDFSAIILDTMCFSNIRFYLA